MDSTSEKVLIQNMVSLNHDNWPTARNAQIKFIKDFDFSTVTGQAFDYLVSSGVYTVLKNFFLEKRMVVHVKENFPEIFQKLEAASQKTAEDFAKEQDNEFDPILDRSIRTISWVMKTALPRSKDLRNTELARSLGHLLKLEKALLPLEFGAERIKNVDMQIIDRARKIGIKSLFALDTDDIE